MFFGLFWGDWTILILIPAMIFAFVVQIKVKTTFDRFSKVGSARGVSGADAARKILDMNGLYHVRIERVRGELTDHFGLTQEFIANKCQKWYGGGDHPHDARYDAAAAYLCMMVGEGKA